MDTPNNQHPDDESLFAAEDTSPASEDKRDLVPSSDGFTSPDSWKVLIVDDDEEVHTVTRLVLSKFKFYGAPLKLINAYSGAEAKKVIAENPDTAVMLLDIVMETDHAGLDVVKYIREDLKNTKTRIVLRTGQPGQAPEEEIIEQYDINDYKDKTELTAIKLTTLLYATLRAYRDIKIIEQKKKEVEDYYQQTVTILKASKEHIFNIIDSMPSLLIAVDAKGNIDEWNSQTGMVFNIPRDKAKGNQIFELLPALRPYNKMLNRALNEQKAEKMEGIMLGDVENKRHYDLMMFPIAIGKEPGAVIRLDDITTRLMLDRMMIQSEKMVTIGGLAAGMAHEIKNPLGIIIQNVQNIVHRLDSQSDKNLEVAQELGLDLDKMHQYLEERSIIKFMDNMRIAVERALTIITNMLKFGRSSDQEMSNDSIGSIINDAIDLVSKDYDLKKQFDFQTTGVNVSVQEGIPTLFCSHTQLVQVFLNLLKNAAQAMAGNPDPKISITATGNQDVLTVIVEDNGKGMTPEVKANIFKPFFTTKSEGIGTGLGLSVCKYIVNEIHSGQLEVESEPGKGTKFILTLPTKPPQE
jgi:PAS domain S-box-containing protein